MTKRVIRDYFAAFRWQKIKESQKKNEWWILIYFMALAPLILGVYDSVTGTLAYYLIIVPLLFTMFVPTIHTMKLPKIMYLCPLSMDERREYITKSCIIRIAAAVLVDIIAVMVLLVSGICDGLTAISILLNLMLLSVAIGSGINPNGYGKIKGEDRGVRVIDPKDRKEFLEMWICLAAFLTCLTHYSIVRKEFDFLLVRSLALGLPLVVTLPPTIVYLMFWKQAVAETMTYERQVET